MSRPTQRHPHAILAPLLAADVVLFAMACLLATAAAARVMSLGDVAHGFLALFWLAVAFGLAMLGWGLLGRLPWARLGHGLAYLVLAGGAIEWMLPGASFAAVIGAQVACFGLAVLAMTRRLREWTPAAPSSRITAARP